MLRKIILTIAILASIPSFSQKYLLDQDVNADTVIPKTGIRRKFDAANYFGFGYMAGGKVENAPSAIQYKNSYNIRDGVWGRMKLNRWYAVGAYLEYSRDEYRLKTPIMGDTAGKTTTKWTKQINNNIIAGLFNRINLNGENVSLDLGAYYSVDVLPRVITRVREYPATYSYRKTIYSVPNFMARTGFGFDAKLNYSEVAIYGRYRYSSVYKGKTYDLPKFTFGIMVNLRD